MLLQNSLKIKGVMTASIKNRRMNHIPSRPIQTNTPLRWQMGKVLMLS
jgi:hypothetical protein